MSSPETVVVDAASTLVDCFKRISSEWGLTLTICVPSSSGANQGSFSIESGDKCVSVRMVPLFSDQYIMYVKWSGTCRVVNVASENLNNTRKLRSQLVATIFAPIFRPHGEYPSLAQLPLISLVMISSYLSASELCQLAKTSNSTSKAVNDESLWISLIAKDFPAASSGPNNLQVARHLNRSSNSGSRGDEPVSAGPGSGPARGTYRRLHLERVAERRRQRALEARRLQELGQQRLALLQWRADSYPAFAPDLVLPPLRLGMPDSHAPPPFRLPPFGDTYDTWF